MTTNSGPEGVPAVGYDGTVLREPRISRPTVLGSFPRGSGQQL